LALMIESALAPKSSKKRRKSASEMALPFQNTGITLGIKKNQANMHSQPHFTMGTHAHHYENRFRPGRAAHARNARTPRVHVRRDIHTDWHWENMSARP
jgi:hypothetical protein